MYFSKKSRKDFFLQNIMPLLCASLIVTLASACGKYGPPLAPEAFSPTSVVSLQTVPSVKGISFTWESPTKDQRGKELKTIEGYRIYRKTITKESDIVDTDVEYTLISTIEDTHLVQLHELRQAALEQDKPTRRIKVDESLTKFEYSDTQVSAGQAYIYKIVPINQGGVEGKVSQIIKVLFRGEASEIYVIPYSTLAEEDFFR